MSDAPQAHPYHFPDPPGLPTGANPVDSTTKTVLDLYASEIREFASGIQSISGMSGEATYLFKQNCFSAADSLQTASRLLLENNELRAIHIHKEGASPPPSAVTPHPLDLSLLRSFVRFVSPALIALCLLDTGLMYSPAFKEAMLTLIKEISSWSLC